MRAIVFTDTNKLSLPDIAERQPQANEVVVDVRASGICGTDIEILRGNYGSSAFPLVPGHEFAGVISQIGCDIADFKVGDRVVIDPNFECGTCRSCKKGWAHLCKNLNAYGVTHNGGFAQSCVLKSSAVHPIGNMPFHIAALAEPMGCVLNGLDAAQATRAENAFVFGAGPIGMMLAIGLKVQGVSDISITDIDESRLELAKQFGFTPIVAGAPELDDMRHHFDLVMDATGVPQVAGQIVDFIADGGVGSFFGVCPQDARISVSPFEMFRRQISLVGSHSINHNIPQALDVIRSFGDDIEKLVTHRLPLAEVAEVMRGNTPKASMKIQWVSEFD